MAAGTLAVVVVVLADADGRSARSRALAARRVASSREASLSWATSALSLLLELELGLLLDRADSDRVSLDELRGSLDAARLSALRPSRHDERGSLAVAAVLELDVDDAEDVVVAVRSWVAGLSATDSALAVDPEFSVDSVGTPAHPARKQPVTKITPRR